MRLEYLGKYQKGTLRTTIWFEAQSRSLVSILSAKGHALVQATQKLVLRPPESGKLDPERLHMILASHSASVEFVSTRPSKDMVEKRYPSLDGSVKWLDNALRREERRLAKEKADYDEFRGVRSLTEAHKHFSNQGDAMFDLNQKLIHNATSPQFVRRNDYVPSAHQSLDRVRFRELKDQLKERKSALRVRIDFTRRERIKTYETKVKDLRTELKAERKRDKARHDTVVTTLNEGTAEGVLLTVRSRPRLVQGRRHDAIHDTLTDVAREAEALQHKFKTQLSTAAELIDDTSILAGAFLPDLGAAAASKHAPAQDVAAQWQAALRLKPTVEDSKKVAQAIAKLLTAGPRRPEPPDMAGWPTVDDIGKKRLAYLGLARNENMELTDTPVFFDIDEQGPRHTCFIGSTGSGKSTAANALVEAFVSHGVPVLVFDPSLSWTGLANPCEDPALLSRYEPFGMDEDWGRAFPARVLTVADRAAQARLERFLTEGQGARIMEAPAAGDAEAEETIANLLRGIASAVASWPESRRAVACLVFEEAHTYLGSKRLLEPIATLARTGRVRGLCMVFVTQVWTDLPPVVRANALTSVVLRTGYGQDLSRVEQALGKRWRGVVPKLPPGSGVIGTGDEASPLVVAFRPPLRSLTAARAPVPSSAVVEDLLLAAAPRSPPVNAPRTGLHLDGEAGSLGAASREAQTMPDGWEKLVAAWLQNDCTEATASDLHRRLAGAGILHVPSLRTVQRFVHRLRSTVDLAGPTRPRPQERSEEAYERRST